MKRSGLILAALGLILSSCTVTVDEGNPPPRPRPPRPDVCPRIFQPVCATRFGERETFPNACVARSEGFDVLYAGECRRRPRPQACPTIYQPVCGFKPGDRRTLPNACVARAEGYEVRYEGECRGRPDPRTLGSGAFSRRE